MNLGAVVVGIALSLFIAWAAYLINSGRGSRQPDDLPRNLTPGLTDDELEGSWITRVLVSAVIAAGALAVAMPIYYLTEPDRQANAAEAFEERDIELGSHIFSHAGFRCEDCHGPAGVGGGAPFVEPRSGMDTTWLAPSLNDVFYRFDEDEVRYWITFGRPGTPMPGWGLEGGGAMSSQEIDQVIAYIKSIQIPQAEAVARTDALVAQALSRLDDADTMVAAAIDAQRARVAEIESAGPIYESIAAVPGEIEAVLTGEGTCTDDSAALFNAPCRDDGFDSDRDGIADAAEMVLPDMFNRALVRASTFMSETRRAHLTVLFDPADPFTNTDPQSGDPVKDLDALDAAMTALDAATLNLRITAENDELFLEQARLGLTYLEQSAARRAFAIDFDALAATTDADGRVFADVDEARRAVGLFNAFCARCHTPGYSAGVAFTGPAGAGAWGPSLRDGRAMVQFPDVADHLAFVIGGSKNATRYGVSGIGRGWMPAFGFTLSQADLELIVKFERTL